VIQYPRSGELVVEVPRVGAIILEKPYEYLNRAFEGRLIKGRRVGPQNPGVEWLVGSATQCDPADPRALEALRSLRLQSERVAAAADALDRILRSRVGARLVKVPAEVLGSIGRPIDKAYTEVPRDTAAVLAEVLRKGTAGVKRAIERGYLVSDGETYRVYGWCFLPPDGVIDPGAPPTVSLQYQEEQVQGRRAVQLLTWTLDTDAESIELLCADGSDQPVDGTLAQIEPGSRSGQWRFARGELPPGERYCARARWSEGVVVSAAVQVPNSPAPVPPPSPPQAPPALPVVALAYAYDGPDSAEGKQRLQWRMDQPGDAISLIRVDRGGVEVEGTARELGGELEGEWAFTDGTLPGGSTYLARVALSGASGDSNSVTVPKRRGAISRRCRRCCICSRRLCSLRWLKWLFAALLALLALALLAWILFSGSCSGVALPTGLFGSRDKSTVPPQSPRGNDGSGSGSPSRTPRTSERPATAPAQAPATQPISPRPDKPPVTLPVRPSVPSAPSAIPSEDPIRSPAPAGNPQAPLGTSPSAPVVNPPVPRPGGAPSPVAPSTGPSVPAGEPAPRELSVPGGRRPIKIVDPGIRHGQSSAPRAQPGSSGTPGGAGSPGELAPAVGGAEGTRP
jgi:hypothetical protein